MKRKILVVEDEQALSDAYDIILKGQGHTVTVAHDGSEALEITKTLEPDLILLDLRMPKVNGIEFLEIYKPLELHPNVKVIVFSNLDTQNEIDRAYALGANKYIIKAWVSPKELIKLVKDMFDRPQKEQS
jgi:two-component system, OmpR family, alkaline phosphatase synthesis response regulator PhoP